LPDIALIERHFETFYNDLKNEATNQDISKALNILNVT
jgi:hypothetical protein